MCWTTWIWPSWDFLDVPVPARRWNFCQKLIKRQRPKVVSQKTWSTRASLLLLYFQKHAKWCSATMQLKESALAQLFSAICSCTFTTSMGCVHTVAPTTATPLASKFSLTLSFLQATSRTKQRLPLRCTGHRKKPNWPGGFKSRKFVTVKMPPVWKQCSFESRLPFGKYLRFRPVGLSLMLFCKLCRELSWPLSGKKLFTRHGFQVEEQFFSTDL